MSRSVAAAPVEDGRADDDVRCAVPQDIGGEVEVVLRIVQCRVDPPTDELDGLLDAQGLLGKGLAQLRLDDDDCVAAAGGVPIVEPDIATLAWLVDQEDLQAGRVVDEEGLDAASVPPAPFLGDVAAGVGLAQRRAAWLPRIEPAARERQRLGERDGVPRLPPGMGDAWSGRQDDDTSQKREKAAHAPPDPEHRYPPQ